MDTDLGVSAEDFYSAQRAHRTGAVEVARRVADLTIPSVFPEENWKTGDDLATLNQSISARAVNTLSTKLTQVALPPNLPFVKFTPEEQRLQEDIKQDPELWGQTQYALSRREQTHRERLETTTARSAYQQNIRLLLVTGNSLTIWTDLDNPVVYNMHSYVVLRSASGLPLVTVAETFISAAEADEDVKEAALNARAKSGPSGGMSDWEDEIKVYHVQKILTDDNGERTWLYWQEVEGGFVIPDTEAVAPFDVPHMYPAGMIRPMAGADWYLPYALDYEGDHQAVETFASSLQDGAAALAWFLFFVDITGQTKLKDVQDADSLDVLPGRADDVTVLQAQKGGDLATVSGEFQEASRRLGYAYAMHTSIQRPGERVTAEEWKNMARELNETMGGLYADLASGFQRWFVLRFIHLHQLSDKRLGKLPKELVRIGVMTGVESIGQDTDLTNLQGWAQDAVSMMGPEAFAAEINRSELLRRTASLRAIKLEGLIKSPEQKQADTDQAMAASQQQTLLEQGTGPMAKEGAAVMAEMFKQQQGEANG